MRVQPSKYSPLFILGLYQKLILCNIANKEVFVQFYRRHIVKTSGWQRAAVLALLALILCGIFVGCRKKNEEPMKIEPGIGIGKVAFGMTAKEVQSVLGKPDYTDENCISYDGLGLSIYIFRGFVKGITCIGISGDPDVKPCTARTSKGIGIGSTREQIIEAYGKPTSDDRNILKYESIGATFMVSEDGMTETMLFNQVE